MPSIERSRATRDIQGRLKYLYYLTKERIHQQNRGSMLGLAWWFLDPVINTAILYVIARVIIQSRTENLAMFLLAGLLMFRFLSSAIMDSCNSLKPALVLSARLHVTKHTFVVRDIAAQLLQFLIGMIFILILLFLLGLGDNVKPIQLAVVVSTAAAFVLGVASIVALGSAIIPDLRVILGYVFRLLFFISGTFFSIDRIPEEWRSWFLANPFALLIHEFRIALLQPGPLDYWPLSVLLILSLGLGVVGFSLLWKFDRVLPKYVG